MDLKGTIPEDVLRLIENLKVKEANLAAGPAFVATQSIQYPTSIGIDDCLANIESYADRIRAFKIIFEDGSSLVFNANRFNKYYPSQGNEGL